MWLSANRITRLVQAGTIVIEPFDERLLKPASYVLRLGSECLVWRDLAMSISLAEYSANTDHFERLRTENVCLSPGRFVLASSLESVRLPVDVVGVLSTLSHVARFGINVLQSSTLVSPGFGNNIPTALTFELVNSNPNPIRLRPGLPVCHIGFQQLIDPGTPNDVLRSSIYERRVSPVPPMYSEEFSDFCVVPKAV
jgi:dCTP deaminase